MITVNSLSGGKTSSYIAANYPADVNVFALVCMDDHNANGGSTTLKVDAKIRQMVNDKLQKYCSHQREFVATAEDPIILKTMFDLEQHIGSEIIWVRGEGFNFTSFGKSMLPNQKHRWCTSMFKIKPIFELLYMYFSLPCKMRIGYRADEAHRVDTFKENYIFSDRCDFAYEWEEHSKAYKRKPIRETESWLSGYDNGRSLPHIHRWTETPFRVGEFPLVEDGKVQRDIQKFWQPFEEAGLIDFPEDSNCQFCFWKRVQQLRKNWDRQPGIMGCAAVVEAMLESTLLAKMSLLDVRNVAPQLDLFQMDGGGCQGGYCTN